MQLPSNPLVYEIHAAAFLQRLSTKYDHQIRLDSIPDYEWDQLAGLGVQVVWLMGAWQRSPAGLRLSTADKAFLSELQQAIPGLKTSDVIGSAYCVRDYVVAKEFGGTAGLAAARKQLAERGIGLMLDFVPNHAAPDHPWISQHPEYFITGDASDIKEKPANFLHIGDVVFARGRDPNLAAWPDVVQLNAFSEGYRQAAVEALCSLADQSDAVRCDMAMLMLNDVFAETWGERAGKKPTQDFWAEVIAGLHETHPDFQFLAEAYWDTETQLIEQGFNYCYDKTLYDLLLEGSPHEIHDYLDRTNNMQKNFCRFIENHDEARAAAVFPPDKTKAAAAAALTLPGMPFLHDGQLEGFKTKIPVHVNKGLSEATNNELLEFYKKLLHTLSQWHMVKLQWYLWQTDNKDMLAWEWRDTHTRHIIVINYSEHKIKADLQVDAPTKFTDALANRTITTNDQGRFSLALHPWEVVLLSN